MTDFGIIGVGRIGTSFARNMSLNGIKVSLYDKNFDTSTDIKTHYSELESSLVFDDINKFIIGYPLGMNLSENRMTKNVDNFIKEELMKFNLPISKIDERFTSELIKNTKKDRIDDLSALEILETYIKNND